MNSPSKQTTVERLTPRGRGAVATIRVCGEINIIDTFFSAVNQKSIQRQPVNAIRYGVWGSENSEDLVCVRTDETTVEIHCHGGAAAVNRILSDLTSLEAVGGREAIDAISQKSSLQEEFQHCLQQVTTQRTAHEVLRQSTLFPLEIERIQSIDPADRATAIKEMLRWSEFGQHLTHPWKVVLCGPPNVGKSSLINSLVGFSRSVVFDQPGTTRDVVTVQTALEGWPIEFSDTAGLRHTDEEIEFAGIEKAKRTIGTADLVLIIVDARIGISSVEKELATGNPRSLFVYNKIDLADCDIYEDGCVSVSATAGTGIELLASKIVSLLIPVSPPHGQAYPVSPEQVALLQGMLIRNESG